MAKHQGFAGAHGNPPEIYFQPHRAEYLLDQIMVANRYTAGGDQHIGPARAFGHGSQRNLGIRRDPEIDRVGATGDDKGTQRQTIGTDNLVATGSEPWIGVQ